MRRTVRTVGAPLPVGAYSQAVISGDLVFTAGQIGIDPSTGMLEDGLSAQTARALSNVREILREAGTDMDGVLKLNLYITDMSDFDLVNRIYSSSFEEPYPARSIVQAAALPLGALIEIEAVAVIHEGGMKSDR
ncbi:MAG: RidA family protein [Candidatus Fermentibacteraceae bacterium]|nr:RidA family protein [Candidatus Fermentibacteraceae bacterium]MBN2609809.1 RidA family protein [Candidatus Fermentibacteraceae bacterium]